MKCSQCLVITTVITGFFATALGTGFNDSYVRSASGAELEEYVSLLHANENYEYKCSVNDGTFVEYDSSLQLENGKKVYSLKGAFGFTFIDGTAFEVDFKVNEDGFQIVDIKRYKDDRINPKAVGSLLGG